jgi:iron complex outermembrane recepter protein
MGTQRDLTIGSNRGRHLASTALVLIAVACGASEAWAQSATEIAPVDVTTRRAQPAARPRRAPVARVAPTPAPRPRVARAPVRRPAPPVRLPASSADTLASTPQPGASTVGPANGEPRGDGPVRGFVATRSTSGTKTDTPRLETPQSSSVVGREQIDFLKPQTSLVEATAYTPGIVSGTFGANDPRSDFFLIRGFDASQTGLFLDNLSLFSTGFATFRLEPFGLERIEVLRGPSSVLYGGSNPGGLINAISKKPTAEPLRYVEFGVNSFGQAYGAFDLSGPVVVNEYGAFAARLTGLTKGGGTQTAFTGDDRLFIAPSLTWRPTADTSLTILASYQRDSANGRNFLPYEGTAVRAPFGRISTRLFTSEPNIDKFEREQTLAGYEFQHRVDDGLTFRQNFRFSSVGIDYRTLYGGGYATAPTATSADLTRFNFVTTPQARVLNVDNQAELKFVTGPLSHTVLLGLDYRRYSLDDTQGFEFGPTLNLLRPVYSNTVQPTTSRYRVANVVQDQLGLYAQDQIKLGQFTLVLSGREDLVSTSVRDKLFSGNYDSDDRAFSGRAGLIYNFDFGLAPYVAYSRSFVPQIGFLGSSTSPLAPERGEQYEAGVKYQPFGNLGYVGLSFFDLTRQNVTTSDPNNFIFTTQAGEVNVKGFEVEAVANLAEGLKVVGAYTGYDQRVTRNLDPASLGKLLPNTPDHFASLLVDYTIPTGPLAGFGGGAGVRYVGRSYADTANGLRVPGRVLGDLFVHYEYAGWRAAINVQNLTDEIYVAGCSAPAACFYGDRRRVTGSLSYKW